MAVIAPVVRTETERAMANARIDKAIADFLESGGKITHVPHAKFAAKQTKKEIASFWQRSSSKTIDESHD